MSEAPCIYLDHAASEPILPDVIEAHRGFAESYWMNPHVSTKQSEEALRSVYNAERELLTLLGIPPQKADVIWTSGGTEAANLPIQGWGNSMSQGALFVEVSGHAAIVEPTRHMFEKPAITGGEIPVQKDGQLDLAQMDRPPSDTPALVSLCHVNNETGVTQDLKQIRGWLDQNVHRPVLFVDALQSFGKISIPWEAAQIDLLAIGGRKIGGPPSIGALIKRSGVELSPLFFGGDQQNGLRPGTLDAVSIHEFLMAAQAAVQDQANMWEHMRELNALLRTELTEELAAYEPVILSPSSASPYIVAVAFPGYEGSILMRMLAEEGIVTGTGSACRSEKGGLSHVIRAMGYPDRVNRGMLRISFGRDNSRADVKALVSTLKHLLAGY